MGLLSFLFKNKPSKNEANVVSYSFIDNFIKISAIDFFGPYTKSQNGQWIIAWCDADRNNKVGGFRKSGNGKYILINALNRTIVCTGELQRPNNGHVANNGIFSLEDWHFGSGLSGDFVVFGTNGARIASINFNSNIYNSYLSENGLFAITQTANSTSDDGNKLTALDIKNNEIIFSTTPKISWAKKYYIDEDNIQFHLIDNGIDTLILNKHGDLLNADNINDVKLNSERYDLILSTASILIKNKELDSDTLNKIVAACNKSISLGATETPSWHAIALKTRGLAYDQLQDFDSAIADYKMALSINTKIGVKKRLDYLIKNSSSTSLIPTNAGAV